MPQPLYELGQPVQYRASAKKFHPNTYTTSWERIPLDEPNEGVIIGQRFLSDYEIGTETEYGEYGVHLGTWSYAKAVHGTSRRAWLIAYHLRRKPVLVFEEDISAL